MRETLGKILMIAIAAMLTGSRAGAEIQLEPHQVDVESPYAKKIVEVAVPEDTCIAVSDNLHLLAIARKNADAAQIVLYRLDDQGELAEAEPVMLDIPVPEICTNCFIYVQEIIFHPSEPLLYVWRDMRGKVNDYPTNEFVFENFAHLLIYRWEDGKFVQVSETAKGSDFAFGVINGSMAFSPSADKLFVPNTQQPNADQENRFTKMVGYYELDEHAMPAKLVKLPTRPRYPEHMLNPIGNYNNFPFGQGNFLVLDENTVGYSDKHDVVILHMDEDPRSPLYEQRFGGWEPFYVVMTDCIANPSKPALYVASSGQIIRLTHHNGYFTLLPQRLRLPSNPFQIAVLASGDIAVGTEYIILVVHTDDEGNLTGDYERIKLSGWGYVNCLAYSRKFDRIYAVVDRLPEKKADGKK